MEIDYIWLVNELYKDANHVTCFAVSLPTAKTDPSDEDWDRAKAALLQIHRAAGHPPMRNLVRALRQAQKPEWLIRCAESLRCPACDATQLGNQLIPNASLAETPRPWEVLGMDTLELTTPDRKWKVRLLLMMDMATHLLVGAELSRFEVSKRKKGEGHQETAEEVLRAIATHWLQDKPRPKWWICDSATYFSAGDFTHRAAEMGIGQQLTPGQAPWSHGALERAIQTVKKTAEAIMADDCDVDPSIALLLAIGASNRLEQVHGYSPVQWVYGTGDGLRDAF